MDHCTAIIKLGKTCQNCFCPSWRCLHCMMAFAGGRELSQQSNNHVSALHCVNLDKESFDMLYKMIAEQPSLTQYE